MYDINGRSKSRQWKPTNDTEMLKFFGIIIEMGLVQMPELEYYWSSSTGAVVNYMDPKSFKMQWQEIGLNNSSSSGIFRTTEKLKRGEAYGLQNKEGIKLVVWKDKKDVLMISTKPSHSAAMANTGKINFENEPIMKPQIEIDYNRGRQGTDLFDQLSAYYTCLRRSIK
ncbi:unnamed protein product [Rotaria magnacalcarata]|uniref:PiggyBac transposable element-derived protein domain-containing protein n=1 Tax=Rotaria magnacalcarata TaxID=392030 RepID=A0A819TF04_9BILA|nr:unnamed protein product [Rotaria magnacalcarata]CAF4111247.1 unnamed protein product [Rotaria magnacalcarata]